MGLLSGNSNHINILLGLWPDDYDEPYEEAVTYQKFVDKNGYYVFYTNQGGEGVIFPWSDVLVKIHYRPTYFEVCKIEGDSFLKYERRSLPNKGGEFKVVSVGLKGSIYDPSFDFGYTEDVRKIIVDSYDKAIGELHWVPLRNFPKEILPDIYDFMRDPFNFPPELLKLGQIT